MEKKYSQLLDALERQLKDGALVVKADDLKSIIYLIDKIEGKGEHNERLQNQSRSIIR